MNIPSLPSTSLFPGFRGAAPTSAPGAGNSNPPGALRKVLAQGGGPGGDQLDALGRRFDRLLARLGAPGQVNQGDEEAVRAHASRILDQIDEAVRGGLLSLADKVDPEFRDGVEDYADLFRGALDQARERVASGDSFDLGGLINEVRDAFGQTVEDLRGYLGDQLPPGEDPFSPGGVTGTLTTPPGDPGPTTEPPPTFGDADVQPGPGGSISVPGPTGDDEFGDVDSVAHPDDEGDDGDDDDRGGSLRVDVGRIRSAAARPGERQQPPVDPVDPVDPGSGGTSVGGTFADRGATQVPADGDGPDDEGGLGVDVDRLRTAAARPNDRPHRPEEPEEPDDSRFAEHDLEPAGNRPAPPAGGAARDALPQLFAELLQRFDSLIGDLESLRDARARQVDRLS